MNESKREGELKPKPIQVWIHKDDPRCYSFKPYNLGDGCWCEAILIRKDMYDKLIDNTRSEAGKE